MKDTVQNVIVAITGLLLLVMIMGLYVEGDQVPASDPPWAVSNLSDARARTALRHCTKRGGVASVTHYNIGRQSFYNIQCQPVGKGP
jgi:hypothetical protein